MKAFLNPAFCLSILLMWTACDRNQPDPITLNRTQSLAMAINEPSGLALSNDQLLSVSDDDN
ncbi:MAG: hypothetical protein AAGM67_01660, partial [Bacteroidota bacterium]